MTAAANPVAQSRKKRGQLPLLDVQPSIAAGVERVDGGRVVRQALALLGRVSGALAELAERAEVAVRRAGGAAA